MLNNETLGIIKQRRSIRNFEDKQISDEELNTIIEVGVYAPSGSGQIEEYIHFCVIQNNDILDRINKISKEFAAQTQIPHLIELGQNKDFNCLYNAPTLIIISYNINWIQPETDCAAATQNMLLAVESIGLGGCWLYFPLQAFISIQGNELLKELKIPEEYKPYQSIIIGYKKDENIEKIKREIKNISIIK
jgi:nitroreductase